MLLSGAEFDERLASGELRIALIGMSNIGKSYTARRIAKACDFTHYDVDAFIQERMGNPSMEAMAKWMGQPYEAGYAQRAAEYLELETELTLAANHKDANQVLDTTGSVVHIDDDALKVIKNNSLIIYIQASLDDIDMLTKRFFKYPKPTIWGDVFRPSDGLSNKQLIQLRYPQLLNARAGLYEMMADITISATSLSDAKLADKGILSLIRQSL
ncbi:MAG: hypothetical protein JKY25_10205 [Robiginitomaculum sp.]|nr:hypothetical protein [Robiginitomaculum sp.]